jgi:pimeloyl-ACP methyl ester carboxylesterase
VDKEGRLIRSRSALLAVALLVLVEPATAQVGLARRAADCEALARSSAPGITIEAATAVEAGDFNAPDGERHDVPRFCRVQAVARPTSDSSIGFELWMPAEGWNGRYYQLGNGGFGGRIHYPSLLAELEKGNAVSQSDTGHQGNSFDGSWALEHPEKILDYGYRSLKVTTDATKRLVGAYYATGPRRSYFVGCSNGGRQALMAAQRFPEDWDGVLAGAPALEWTRQLAAFAWQQQALRSDADSLIPASKLPAIQRAAVASCAPAARVVDGVPADPRYCDFKPSSMICESNERDDCLTARQTAVLDRLHNGLRDPLTGVQVLYGFEATSATVEGQWAEWIVNPAPGPGAHSHFAEQFFRNLVFDDPTWTIDAFDLIRDLQHAQEKRLADESLARALDATDTTLEPFAERGGKLLMYFGWADALIAPRAGVDYYERVSEKIGGIERLRSFFRLFMVPGMAHCQGGPAPHAFGQADIAPALRDDSKHDIRRALEAWVERGRAPDELIAVKYVDDDRSRGVANTATLQAWR